jgi:hypothetical protein
MRHDEGPFFAAWCKAVRPRGPLRSRSRVSEGCRRCWSIAPHADLQDPNGLHTSPLIYPESMAIFVKDMCELIDGTRQESSGI